jgi:hypothetical protein
MLSEAKHLLCFQEETKQVLRFAQDDKSGSRATVGLFRQPDSPLHTKRLPSNASIQQKLLDIV